jgi:hypothetical protein
MPSASYFRGNRYETQMKYRKSYDFASILSNSHDKKQVSAHKQQQPLPPLTPSSVHDIQTFSRRVYAKYPVQFMSLCKEVPCPIRQWSLLRDKAARARIWPFISDWDPGLFVWSVSCHIAELYSYHSWTAIQRDLDHFVSVMDLAWSDISAKALAVMWRP